MTPKAGGSPATAGVYLEFTWAGSPHTRHDQDDADHHGRTYGNRGQWDGLLRRQSAANSPSALPELTWGADGERQERF
jgi:hypothetical protein